MLISYMIPLSTSKAIYWLQVFLAITVVIVHTGREIPTDHAYYPVILYFNYGLILPEMGCFYLLAGYLMFAKFEHFGVQEYRKVVSRRLVSLVLPWLIWCTIGYISYVLLSPEKNIPPFWRLDLIYFDQHNVRPFYITKDITIPQLGTPFGNTVMYCIRDIFIASLLSPIIWWTVRRLRLWTVVILLLIYLAIARTGIGPGRGNWIFIPIGASLSISRFNLERFCKKLGWPIIILWLILTMGVIYIRINFDEIHRLHGLWTRLYLLSTFLIGVLSYLILAFKATEKRNALLLSLVPYAFFIIAIHVLPFIEKPLIYATNYTTQKFNIGENWQPLVEFFYLVPVRIALIVGLATLLTNLFPGIMKILTGQRSLRQLNN